MKDIVCLGENKYLVIDLSLPLNLKTEVFPGDPKLTREVFSKIDKTGYEHYIHRIGDHNFQPHSDAPKHQILNLQDKGVEFFNNFDYIFNNAILIDLSNSSNAEVYDGIKFHKEIDKKDLLQYKDKLSKAGAVLIRTGYDKWIEKNKPHIPDNIPYLSDAAAKFLSSFNNLKVIGIDSLTIDKVGIKYAHELLTEKKLVIESLVHLDKIPLEYRDKFTLLSKILVIEGATGAPVIAFAFIELK